MTMTMPMDDGTIPRKQGLIQEDRDCKNHYRTLLVRVTNSRQELERGAEGGSLSNRVLGSRHNNIVNFLVIRQHPAKCPFTLSIYWLNLSIAGCPLGLVTINVNSLCVLQYVVLVLCT
jgi:hypothetical protein